MQVQKPVQAEATLPTPVAEPVPIVNNDVNAMYKPAYGDGAPDTGQLRAKTRCLYDRFTCDIVESETDTLLTWTYCVASVLIMPLLSRCTWANVSLYMLMSCLVCSGFYDHD